MMLERVWLDDLKLFDCTDQAWPIGLTAANLGSGPEPRVSSEGKPSADGTINRTRYWGPRMVELVGYCVDDTRAETTARLDEVRAAFSLREPHTLRFVPVGQAERELAVVVASRLDAPVEGMPPVLEWAITLEAPDPRLYDVAWTEVSYEPTAGTGTTTGLFFPLDFLLVFSTVTEGSGAAVLSAWNDGTVATPVRLTLEGPVTSLRGIRNKTTGEELFFGLIGLDQGETIVADTGARTITLEGQPAPELIDASANTWFELAPGENILDVHGAGFLPGATRLTARYREANL